MRGYLSSTIEQIPINLHIEMTAFGKKMETQNFGINPYLHGYIKCTEDNKEILAFIDNKIIELEKEFTQ